MNEKEHAFLEYEVNQKKQLKRGKILVWLIAGAEILSALYSMIFNFNFQQLIFSAISMVLAFLLLSGYGWVRHLYASVASFNIVLGMAATMVFFDASEAALWYRILFYGGWILFIVINTAAAGLLFFNKSIKEYMYWKRNS